MTNVIYIADRDDASVREAHGAPVPAIEDDSGELPSASFERHPKSESESVVAPTLRGSNTLSSDPRFLDGVSRALAAAPEWNRSTRSRNGRILAISMLVFACLGIASAIVEPGRIDSLGTTMLGSANLVFLSGFCWRFSKFDPPHSKRCRSTRTISEWRARTTGRYARRASPVRIWSRAPLRDSPVNCLAWRGCFAFGV
jgi:hypothetical protein